MIKKVLVVDDDKSLSESLSEMFSSKGYSARSANSGQHALAVMRMAPPDIVFLDMFMPGMDGNAVLRAKRAIPEIADIPVVVLTASPDMAKVEADVKIVLAKPSTIEEILAAADLCFGAAAA